MSKGFAILMGITLILMGVLGLAFTLIAPLLGWGAWHWGVWRLWPSIVVACGMFFVVPPLLTRGHRGLGGLFIPGVPVLTTGVILLIASVFNTWDVWAWLWPLEVLAVAVGFLFAAIYMRVIWLLIPTFIVGANGLVLQFCAITGWWGTWAALWTVEPLALGLVFLVIAARKRIAGLFLAGLILCGIAAFGLVLMTAVLPGLWLMNLIGPAILIVVGALVLIWNLVRRSPMATPAAPTSAE